MTLGLIRWGSVVAGANPAVPIGQMKARQQDTVVGLFFVAPDRAKGST